MKFHLRYLLNGAGDSAYSMVNGLVEIVCRLVFVFVLTNISFIGQWGISYQRARRKDAEPMNL